MNFGVWLLQHKTSGSSVSLLEGDGSNLHATTGTAPSKRAAPNDCARWISVSASIPDSLPRRAHTNSAAHTRSGAQISHYDARQSCRHTVAKDGNVSTECFIDCSLATAHGRASHWAGRGALSYLRGRSPGSSLLSTIRCGYPRSLMYSRKNYKHAIRNGLNTIPPLVVHKCRPTITSLVIRRESPPSPRGGQSWQSRRSLVQ